MMKSEFREGPEALENFEEGMKAIFSVPKDAVVRAEKKLKKKRASHSSALRKLKPSDKD
jgi:hypothetical protein